MNPAVASSIPVNRPLLDGNERAYVLECLDAGWISSEGPFIKRFEEKFAAVHGCKYGVAVSNGSAALDAAVLALDLGPGDEVILPSFTIISCASAVVRAGAVPVVVDSDPATWNMDVSRLAAAITPRTRAIMVVHIYGLPVDMEPVLALAERHGLKIIEDNAEEQGQTYRGRICGSFGDIAAFSFYANKHVTTGEGGMLLTNNPVLADRCRALRNLCFQPPRRFLHHELGWNLRMTNLQAAVGLAQTESMERHVAMKRRIGRRYNELLADLQDVQLPLERMDYAENIYWVYGLVLGTRTPSTPPKSSGGSKIAALARGLSSGRCTSNRCSREWAFLPARDARWPSGLPAAVSTSRAASGWSPARSKPWPLGCTSVWCRNNHLDRRHVPGKE